MFNFKTESGASVVRFRRNTANSASNNNGNMQQFPIDRILEVMEVHPASNGEGFLIAKDVDNGKTYNVKISNESYQRQKDKTFTSGSRNLQGISAWLIDEKFEQAMQQSRFFVATQTKFSKKREVVNGEETFFITAEWFYHYPEYTPEKLSTGILTAYAFRPKVDEYVQSYQKWNEQAVAINGSDESADLLQKEFETFDDIAQKLEEIRIKKEEAKDTGRQLKVSYPVRRGFQVVAFKITKEVNEKGEEVIVNTAVDSYIPLTQTEALQDDLGNVTEKSKPITSEYLEDFLSKYAEYAYSTFTEQAKDTYDLSKNIIPKDVLVEVMFFNNYMCNNLGNNNKLNDPNGEKPKFPTPLQRMTQKETKPFFDATERDYYQGMNLAVRGVLDLSSDTVDMATRQFLERNNARRAFVSGRKMNVLFLVKRSNGGKTKISDTLRTQEELEAIRGGFNNGANNLSQIEQDNEHTVNLLDDDIL